MEIIKGKRKKPFSVILHGEAGVGKTTWASNAPKPIFVGAEENDEIECDRMKIPNNWDEYLEQLSWLAGNHHNYETLVLDTIDGIEKLLHAKVLASDKKQTGSMVTAHGGFSKAYDIAMNHFIKMREMLRALRDSRQMNIIILAHSEKVKETNTVLASTFDSFEMALHKKSQAVFVDWVSCVLFATYNVQKKEDANTDKIFAAGDGERVVFAEKRPGFLAKNRYGLPLEMQMDFSEFYQGYLDFYKVDDSRSALEIRESIFSLCGNLKPELVIKVQKSIDKAGDDIGELIRIENKVKENL